MNEGDPILSNNALWGWTKKPVMVKRPAEPGQTENTDIKLERKFTLKLPTYLKEPTLEVKHEFYIHVQLL